MPRRPRFHYARFDLEDGTRIEVAHDVLVTDLFTKQQITAASASTDHAVYVQTTNGSQLALRVRKDRKRFPGCI